MSHPYNGIHRTGYYCGNPVCRQWFQTRAHYTIHRVHLRNHLGCAQYDAIPANTYAKHLAKANGTELAEQATRTQRNASLEAAPLQPRLAGYTLNDGNEQHHTDMSEQTYEPEHEHGGGHQYGNGNGLDTYQHIGHDDQIYYQSRGQDFSESWQGENNMTVFSRNAFADGQAPWDEQGQDMPWPTPDERQFTSSAADVPLQPTYENEEFNDIPIRPELDIDFQPIGPEPEPLYNPLDNGFEPMYTRTKVGNITRYTYASAGGIVQKAGREKTRWERFREKNDREYGGSEYGRWLDPLEWGDADYMADARISQADLNKLLKTARYLKNPPRFKTIKKLIQIIETELVEFGGPKFELIDIRLPEADKDRHTLVYRDAEQAGNFLFGSPQLYPHMSFAPIIDIDENGVRHYHNVSSGDYWNLRQSALPPGTTLGAGIFMSDATHLSQFTGDVSAHGVYMSLCNIDKSVRAEINSGAWLLIGIIPKSNWDKTIAAMKDPDPTKPPMPVKRRAEIVSMLNRRLFHFCMEIITRPFRREEPVEVLDAQGNTRLVQYDLSVYGADLEEQCHIAGISRNACPHGGLKGKSLGNRHCPDTRTSQAILERIKETEEDVKRLKGHDPEHWEFLDAGKKYGLNGVQRPFWRLLPNFDVSRVLSLDLLHGFHKAFGDHVEKWNRNAVGYEEYDNRLKAQVPVPGERSFKGGVTKLKQLSGREHKGLGRVHVPIVANASDGRSNGAVTQRLVRASRAFMDCISLAQLPVHTEKTLSDYKKAYGTFYEERNVWIEKRCKLGAKGKLIEDWAIPKIHIMSHAPDHIRQKGTLDNSNTETMERLHIPVLKDGYRASNRKGYLRQIVRRLTRHEIWRAYREFFEWYREVLKAERLKAAMEAGEDVGLNPSEEEESDEEEEDDSEDDDEDDDNEDSEDDENDEHEDGDEDEESDGDNNYDECDCWGDGNNEERGGGDRNPNNNRKRGRDTDPLQGPERPEFREPTEHRDEPSRPTRHVPQLTESTQRNRERDNFPAIHQPILVDIGGVQQRTDGEGDRSARKARLRFPRGCEKPPTFPMTISPIYRIAKTPNNKSVSIADITRRLDFSRFLKHLNEHPYFITSPVPIRASTLLTVWSSVRVTAPGSRISPAEKTHRIYSHSGLDEKIPRRWDAAYYIPTVSPIVVRNPVTEVIQEYSVGRVALLFALKKSAEVPEPRLMAYVERFSDIPESPTSVTGLYVVKRLMEGSSGQSRFEVIAASQLARPCPLSPQIKGAATPGVEGHQSLEHYQRFYINKYRTPLDFQFIHFS